MRRDTMSGLEGYSHGNGDFGGAEAARTDDESMPSSVDILKMGSIKRKKKKDRQRGCTGGPSAAGGGGGGGDLGKPPPLPRPPASVDSSEKSPSVDGEDSSGRGSSKSPKKRLSWDKKLAAAVLKRHSFSSGDKKKKEAAAAAAATTTGAKGKGKPPVLVNAAAAGGARSAVGEAGRGGDDEAAALREQLKDAGEIDGTQDIPAEYRDAQGNFKMMPVPRHLGSLTRRKPPLVAIVGVAGCGKSRLASALLGRAKEKQHRALFGVGTKTVAPKVVVGEELSVLDCPGLPDPLPRISDTYYNDTVTKLRSLGYINAILFVVNQERVTPTLVKNYALLFRAFNRLDCAKLFVLRRETSFLLLNKVDQELHETESRATVLQILEATNLKKWENKQFFMLTAGSGEEQDKQIKAMRDQVRKCPRVEITATEGLRLTTEVRTEEVSGDSNGDGEGNGNGKGNGKGKKSKKSSPARANKSNVSAAKNNSGNVGGGGGGNPASQGKKMSSSKNDAQVGDDSGCSVM